MSRNLSSSVVKGSSSGVVRGRNVCYARQVLQNTLMAVPPPHDRDPTYFELIAESFTTGDNLNHNAGIASQTTLIRTMLYSATLGICTLR